MRVDSIGGKRDNECIAKLFADKFILMTEAVHFLQYLVLV